jgi:NAD(P)-dependent dehydrogenase (short-subunit alcohol dehydrogenase family)
MMAVTESRMLGTLFDLRGRVAVVTGGRSGLGADIAAALAESGSDVIVTSRSRDAAAEAAARLAERYETDALGLGLDVRSHRDIVAASRAALEWKGRIDVLVNNAGGGSGASTGDLFERSLDDIRDLLDTNLLGTLLCCREFAQPMLHANRGKIINLASIAALVGRDRSIYSRNGVNEQPVDYAAAKAGVLGLTYDLAAKLAPFNVQVNAISPGGFDKGHLPEGFVHDYAARTALGRMGALKRDIKGACQFLASDASDYVTGHNLVVDGGFTRWK